jgi:hypothetical protein
MGASPQDRKTLAPVDVREHSGWLALIQNVFQRKNISTVTGARGINPTRLLTVGYSEQYNQRVSPSAAKIAGTASRGSMAPVPTPQALIRQVTGIGSSTQGR